MSAAAGLVLLESARRARTHRVDAGEEAVFRRFNDMPDSIHAPSWLVMQSGSLAAVFVASGVVAHRGRWREAGSLLATGVAVWGGVKLVKPLVGRGRPAKHVGDVNVRGRPQTGLGFPSGHAAVAVTMALLLTADAPLPVRLAALAAAGATASARMYVGAHLPLDVAGGIAIGLLAADAARRLL